jgi:hypothetical protein
MCINHRNDFLVSRNVCQFNYGVSLQVGRGWEPAAQPLQDFGEQPAKKERSTTRSLELHRLPIFLLHSNCHKINFLSLLSTAENLKMKFSLAILFIAGSVALAEVRRYLIVVLSAAGSLLVTPINSL